VKFDVLPIFHSIECVLCNAKVQHRFVLFLTSFALAQSSETAQQAMHLQTSMRSFSRAVISISKGQAKMVLRRLKSRLVESA